MPFYDFRCNVCGDKMPLFRRIAERNIEAYHCCAPMTRIITAPAVQVDIPAYISPASGKWINSRAQRKEDLLREGCVENEPGLKEYIASRAESEKEKSLAVLDRAIDETASALHAANKI